MRILISLYKENRETGSITYVFSRNIVTSSKIEEIDARMQLYDGYRSVLELGQNLCFWDIYSLIENEEEIKRAIINLPSELEEIQNQTSGKIPRVFMIERLNPGNTKAFAYPDESSCFAYQMKRYECGASGFETIVLWAADHPLHMVFIGGFIWDVTKSAFIKLMRKIKLLKTSDKPQGKMPKKEVIYFCAEKFYSNFEKLTNIPRFNCQIVFLEEKENCFEVHVRTIRNDRFAVECHANGKIKNLRNLDAIIR